MDRKHIAIFLLAGLLLGCVEVITLDLPSGEEKLVVFGWVTDKAGPYEIKVTKTNGFNDPNPYPVVSGATVYLLDSSGESIDFAEQGNSGSYFSQPSFVGINGESYELHIVTLEGHHIVSTRESLEPLPELESTFIEFFLDPDQADVPPEDDNLYLAALINDAPIIENYYRWKIYVNDQLRNSPDDLVLFDDKFTDGNTFRFDASNVLFHESDRVRLECMSMSEASYDYYLQIKNLSGSNLTGPAYQFFSISGNLTDIEKNEEILGFFGASAQMSFDVQ